MLTTTSSTIGYPRIGPKREQKKALESYWAGKSTQADLLTATHHVEEAAWLTQAAAGVNLIALDGTLYDHVLDTCSYLGLLPQRFNHIADPLDRYFAAARGTDTAQALDMSKLVDTNYHYLVPELSEELFSAAEPKGDWSPLFDRLCRGQTAV